jgi:multicomponent Na+:H+ antiporter subunit G
MHLFIDVLLVAGAGAALLSSLGVLIVSDFYDRLHYMGPAGSVGAVAIAMSVLLRTPSSPSGIKVFMVGVLLAVTNSVLTHATARAGRVHQLGDWKPQKGEQIVGEESLSAPGRAHKRKTHRPRHKHSRK